MGFFILLQSPLRTKIFNLVQDKRFDWIALIVVLCNCLLFALDGYGISTELANILYILNGIFIFLLIVEVCLRIVAYGRQYVNSLWNLYDIFVVFYCIFGKIVVFLFYSHAHMAFFDCNSLILYIIYYRMVIAGGIPCQICFQIICILAYWSFGSLRDQIQLVFDRNWLQSYRSCATCLVEHPWHRFDHRDNLRDYRP